jgi:folate-binding protein YgfZ
MSGEVKALPIILTVNASLIPPTADTGHAQALAALCNGALASDSSGPQVLYPGRPIDPLSIERGWVSPIADLGVLHVDGDDALRFLQSQLTNDLEGLTENAWQLSGYCSAKGRLLASMMIWRGSDGIRMVASQPLLLGLRKRLSMFVLRAKVRISDESDRWFLFGIGGERAGETLRRLGAPWPGPHAVTSLGDGYALGCAPVAPQTLANATVPSSASRALLVIPVDDTAHAWSVLGAGLTPTPSTVWRWTEIQSGLPRIVAAGVERFVPQMVNLDLVNGVSFRKGCYPGQEVVARSHYLGKLKRRMFLAHVEGNAPEAGTDVLGPEGAEPCGEVVLAAPSPAGGTSVLFESQIAAADSARLADGRALRRLDLPYAFPGG